MKALMPAAAVQAIAGLCVNPGPIPQNPGDVVNL